MHFLSSKQLLTCYYNRSLVVVLYSSQKMFVERIKCKHSTVFLAECNESSVKGSLLCLSDERNCGNDGKSATLKILKTQSFQSPSSLLSHTIYDYMISIVTKHNYDIHLISKCSNKSNSKMIRWKMKRKKSNPLRSKFFKTSS